MSPAPHSRRRAVANARKLFLEVRRRNVVRAVPLYIGAVWAFAQGIAQLAPYIGAPDCVVRWFLIAAIIGFPAWIIFARRYELTPEGPKRDREVTACDTAGRRATARKTDFAIIGILALAVALLAANRFVPRGRAAAALAEAWQVPAAYGVRNATVTVAPQPGASPGAAAGASAS